MSLSVLHFNTFSSIDIISLYKVISHVFIEATSQATLLDIFKFKIKEIRPCGKEKCRNMDIMKIVIKREASSYH